MGTLVAYDSSSEGDEDVVEQSVPSKTTVRSTAVPNAQFEISLPATDGNEPTIGPVMPPDAAQSYEEYDEVVEDDTSDPPESERDIIRYLTQPSHPMTEMPPSPTGSPNATAAAKFKHFLDLKANGVHFNEDLARKSAFKNASMLQILLNRAGLDVNSTYRTALPSDIFDPTTFPPEGYKEALLKSQQSIRAKEEIEKRALSATGKRTIEFTSDGISAGSSATSTPSGSHKKSKK